jgi:hypothetical protein
MVTCIDAMREGGLWRKDNPRGFLGTTDPGSVREHAPRPTRWRPDPRRDLEASSTRPRGRPRREETTTARSGAERRRRAARSAQARGRQTIRFFGCTVRRAAGRRFASLAVLWRRDPLPTSGIARSAGVTLFAWVFAASIARSAGVTLFAWVFAASYFLCCTVTVGPSAHVRHRAKCGRELKSVQVLRNLILFVSKHLANFIRIRLLK